MAKTIIDLKGNTIIADEFVGATTPSGAIEALTAITTPDATDAASTQTLSNANKAKINQIIAALKA